MRAHALEMWCSGSATQDIECNASCGEQASPRINVRRTALRPPAGRAPVGYSSRAFYDPYAYKIAYRVGDDAEDTEFRPINTGKYGVGRGLDIDVPIDGKVAELRFNVDLGEWQYLPYTPVVHPTLGKRMTSGPWERRAQQKKAAKRARFNISAKTAQPPVTLVFEASDYEDLDEDLELTIKAEEVGKSAYGNMLISINGLSEVPEEDVDTDPRVFLLTGSGSRNRFVVSGAPPHSGFRLTPDNTGGATEAFLERVRVELAPDKEEWRVQAGSSDLVYELNGEILGAWVTLRSDVSVVTVSDPDTGEVVEVWLQREERGPTLSWGMGRRETLTDKTATYVAGRPTARPGPHKISLRTLADGTTPQRPDVLSRAQVAFVYRDGQWYAIKRGQAATYYRDGSPFAPGPWIKLDEHALSDEGQIRIVVVWKEDGEVKKEEYGIDFYTE